MHEPLVVELPPSPPLLRFSVPTVLDAEVDALHTEALDLIESNGGVPFEPHAGAALLNAALEMRGMRDPVLWSDLGVAMVKQREWAKAWSAFQRALKVDPENALAARNRDDLRNLLGDSDPIVVGSRAAAVPREPRRVQHEIKMAQRRLPSAALDNDVTRRSRHTRNWRHAGARYWSDPFVFEAQTALASEEDLPVEQILARHMPRTEVDCARTAPSFHAHREGTP